jgi:tripartite-type tricarboxylate transporter receptor subunit TctC
MTRRTFVQQAAALASVAALPGAAGAQPAWPSRPIRWIVPFLPGTAPDMTVRAVAEPLSEILGQPVVIDNKAGAAGNIGAQQAARAQPDGYTWVYSATPMAGNMRMYKAPGYDVMSDFIHVSRLASSDVLLVVSAESGMRTTKDLIDRMRQQPGKLNYGSGGVGSPNHLGAELLLSVAGVQAVHVPYKGTVDAVNALMGRQLDFALPIFSVGLPHVASGRLTALAVAGPRRNAKLPDVPTLAEGGIEGVSLLSFGGLSVPARIPAPIVARINAAVREALQRPAVHARLTAGGGTPSWSSVEDYTQQVRAQIADTEKMMKLARLEPQ